MSETADLEARVATLEATVTELQNAVAELRKALPQTAQAPRPELRSRGMLDRPKSGK